MSNANPHHIKCLKAVAALHGSIEELAGELEVSPQAAYNWIMNKRIPAKYIKHLVRLSDDRFDAEDFLPED